MNGTITSIEDDIATIEIPDLGEIETGISSLKETQETNVLSQYVTIKIALIAAASSTLSVIFLSRRKTTQAK